MDLKAVVALILAGLSVLLDIVGLAIPYWNYLSVGDASSNMGLWKICSSNEEISLCIDWPETTTNLQATRALVILGLLCAVAALVCFALRQFMMKDKAILNKIAGGLAIGAGLLMLIGAVIYGTDELTKENLHAGFGLVIVAAILALVAAVCMFLSPDDE